MTTTTVADQVERVLKPIQQFVRGWMTGPPTDRLADELGIRSGEDLWIVGRAGVLGDCDADVAAAGLAFLGPRPRPCSVGIAARWPDPPAGGRRLHRRCAAPGVPTELARFDPARMARLDAFGRAIADAADGSIGAVFAGWRAQPQPDDVNARVALDHARAARAARRRPHRRHQRLRAHSARRSARLAGCTSTQRSGVGRAPRLERSLRRCPLPRARLEPRPNG